MASTKKKTASVKASSSHHHPLFHRRRLLQLCFDLDLPLYPFCFEDIVRSSASWYKSSGVCYAMVVTVRYGDVIYELDNQEYHIVPGKILFIPEFQSFCCHSSVRHHKYILELKGSKLSSIISSYGLDHTCLLECADYKTLMALTINIGQAVDTADKEVFLLNLGKSYELLSRLAVSKLEAHPGASPILSHIIEYLEQDLQKKITVSQMSMHFDLSKQALISLVKKHTGLTPMQYRIARKIERAIYYLQIPEMTIKKIAFQLGYCNQCYFAEEFHAATGRSPSDYRKYQSSLRIMSGQKQ